MAKRTKTIGGRYHARARRTGVVLSIEWLVVFPILVAIMLAITEFSLIWSAKHSLEAATYAAAREASLPAIDEAARLAAAKAAAERVLGNPKYVAQYSFNLAETNFGEHTGDPMVVELNLPMEAASPDLLSVVGISIEGKTLKSRTVMRRE